MLRTGDKAEGFTVIDAARLDEFNADGVWLRHETTGLEVYHLRNDDPENLFAFAFLTIPEDSCGAAHILEHSVLCGSKNYPIKDPFLVLSNQSVKTFLNAMTFPDKTVYPASSFVEEDYFNLMSVYGDAVFFPLLDKYTFLQEGWRLEYDASGKLSLQGVVYNEMRGVYSSADAAAEDWACRSVTANSPYAFDSGGDPDCIPDLTYERFCAFHKRFYHPSNCKVFLYGNIPTEKQLRFLEERFLSRFSAPSESLNVDISVPEIRNPYSMRIFTPEQKKAGGVVLLNWLFRKNDPQSRMDFSFLNEVLLGHDASPLRRALLRSKLGEDIAPASGLTKDLKYPIFSCGLRGVRGNKSGEINDLILSVISDIADKGVAPEDAQTALVSFEFACREPIRAGGGPFSLRLMQRSLVGWMHGMHPAATMSVENLVSQVRFSLQTKPRYFEDELRTFFLENPHRCLLTARPDPGREKKKRKTILKKLSETDRSFSAEQRQNLKLTQAELEKKQSAIDDPNLLSRIPYIKPSSLTARLENIPSVRARWEDVPAFLHEQPANEVVYIHIAVPVDSFSSEAYRLLPFYAWSLTNVGCCGRDWTWTAAEAARLSGGYSASLYSGTSAPGADCADELIGRDWLFVRFKTLKKSLDEAAPFLFTAFTKAEFTDTERLKNLTAEYRNTLTSSLVPSGHLYALSRAARNICHSRAADEVWNGVTQIRAAKDLSSGGADALAERLSRLHADVLSRGIAVSVTADADSLPAAESAIRPCLRSFRAPKAKPDRSALMLLNEKKNSTDKISGDEIFYAPMRIGFSASASKASLYGTRESAAEAVFAHWCENNMLWEAVRMKGGAYGVFSFVNALENAFYCATYRDPSPANSLKIIGESLASAAGKKIDQVSIEKAITGMYSKESQPKSPGDWGFTAFLRDLYGITAQMKKARIENMLSLSSRDIQDAAVRIADSYAQASRCIISGKNGVKEAQTKLNAGKIMKIFV